MTENEIAPYLNREGVDAWVEQMRLRADLEKRRYFDIIGGRPSDFEEDSLYLEEALQIETGTTNPTSTTARWGPREWAAVKAAEESSEG